MKKKKHSPQQIVAKLREADALLAQGKNADEVAKALGVATATYFRWRKLYGDSGPTEVKRLKDLERENERLKKLVADLSVDKAILKEIIAGKHRRFIENGRLSTACVRRTNCRSAAPVTRCT